jgi:Holliday junction resolvase YEN1
MGIKGIYAEIGPGDRIALSKLAVETYEKKGRPLRLAIDISIWLFQIQSGKGGTNPALRTFFYRLLRLISLSIHPLFVFDGPNKPPFKRNKRTGPNVASIPEFLAKQLLKQFGLPLHLAPGEAEAECALLQQKGIVDAVLSEDVDTLMFGSGLTIRNWSAEGTLKSKTATHVTVYDAAKTKAGSGLDRPGMILVALMSGGDYIPEGIPGCGPKTACDAARAGFGEDLYKIKGNSVAIAEWKARLVHELRTNESKFFRSKHKALVIPDNFPRKDVLRYYTDPCVSANDRLETLRSTLKWDVDFDIPGLREFTLEAFKWEFVSGAKHFVRNLAPALLVQQLRLRADRPPCDDTCIIAQEEARLVKTIHQKRQHVTTDNSTELRVGYVPIDLVNIDLDAEESDPEILPEGLESEDEDMPVTGEEPGSPKKKRTPRDYDPYAVEKIWVLETYIRIGVPLKIQDYEEAFRSAARYEEMKAARKAAEVPKKKKNTKKQPQIQAGALDKFTKVTKPGVQRLKSRSKSPMEELDLAGDEQEETHRRPINFVREAISKQKAATKARSAFHLPPALLPSSPQGSSLDVLDLSVSPLPQPAKKQRTLRRSQSDTTGRSASHHVELSDDDDATQRTPPRKVNMPLPSIMELSPFVTTRRPRSPIRRTQSIPVLLQAGDTLSTKAIPPRKSTTPKRKRAPLIPEVVELSSSPTIATPSRQKSITNWFSPSSDRSQRDLATSSPPSPSPMRPQKITNTDLQINLVQLSSSPAILPPPSFKLPLSEGTANIMPLSFVEDVKSRGMLEQGPIIPTYADDSDDELPAFQFGVPYTAVKSTTAPLALSAPPVVSQSSSDAVASVTIARGTATVPLSGIATTVAAATSALEPAAKPARVIRVRKSLFGAFVEEDVIDLEASAEQYEQGNAKGMSAGGGQKEGQGEGTEARERKRKRDRGKEWRVSQVEVLDLS